MFDIEHEDQRSGLPLTVGELLEQLKDVPPDTWVYVGRRPVRGVRKELGANEPFVLIEGGKA